MEGMIGFAMFVIGLIFLISMATKPSDHRNDNSEYQKLLKTEEWSCKRDHILERDGHECQWCHRKSTPKNPLQVHHKYYIMRRGRFVEPWDYPDSALITLCRNCHEFAHKTRKPPIFYKK